jgi:hypothetical protein
MYFLPYGFPCCPKREIETIWSFAIIAIARLLIDVEFVPGPFAQNTLNFPRIPQENIWLFKGFFGSAQNMRYLRNPDGIQHH